MGRANEWHVGPERATPDSLGPVYGVAAVELARAVDEVIMSEAHVERLAGGPGEGWMTYVIRSRVFGFPDYASVRVLDEAPGTSSLAIFARARFGRSDLGVNRARVEKWLATLAPMQQEPNVAPGVR
jgi:uncharacterized protein (DUF1499 family)